AQIGSTVKRNFHALGWQLVELPAGLRASDAIKTYKTLDAILTVEPNGRMSAEPPLPASTDSASPTVSPKSQIIPNDPRYGSQWHLPQISAPAAWDVTVGSSN